MTQATDRKGKPLPYCGQELDRLEHLGRPHQRRRYGHDKSGRRVYGFNRLGFRGAEFDPDAPYRVFAFGESHAFGYFVAFDRCWPSRFVDLWTRHRGLDRRDVCYLNFADAGASNAAIARAVVSQCSAIRPDLVLVHFADLHRNETILDGRPHRIGHWLLDEETEIAAREAPGDGLQQTLLELIERGKGYYRFALGPERSQWFGANVDPTCVLDNLLNILLVQSFCRAEGIRLVATCEAIDVLRSPAVTSDPTLGPLAERLDPQALCDFRIWSKDGDRSDDRGHAGPRRHDRFARSLFDFYRQTGEGAASLPAPELTLSPVGDEVRVFYRQLPFNYYGSTRAAARSLRDNPIPETYPDLHRLLQGGAVSSVADCGCGTGWLANTLAKHYDVEITGVDFTPRAVDRARSVAGWLGVDERARFVEADFLGLFWDHRFDLVISLGALHHTVDPRQAFGHVQRWARPGGHVYVGLYHRPGRQPFLEHFRQVVDEGGEEKALEEFRRLLRSRRDDEHLRSWFRDQVLHPRESQHTLRQVGGWLAAAGLELESTSINRFQPFADLEALYELELEYAGHSRRALRQGHFFPGFFTFLARRGAGSVVAD